MFEAILERAAIMELDGELPREQSEPQSQANGRVPRYV